MADMKLLAQIANDVAELKSTMAQITDSVKFKKMILDAVVEAEDRRWRDLNIIICGLRFQQGGELQAVDSVIKDHLRLGWFSRKTHAVFVEQIAADKVRVRLAHSHVKAEILRAAPILNKSPATRRIFINRDLTSQQANYAFLKRQAKRENQPGPGTGNIGSGGVSDALRGSRGGRRGGGGRGGPVHGANNSRGGGRRGAYASASVPPVAVFDENAGTFKPNGAVATESLIDDDSSIPVLELGGMADEVTTSKHEVEGDNDDSRQVHQATSDGDDGRMQQTDSEPNNDVPSPAAGRGSQSFVETFIGAVTEAVANALTPLKHPVERQPVIQPNYPPVDNRSNSVVVRNSDGQGFKKFVPVPKNSIPSKASNDNCNRQRVPVR